MWIARNLVSHTVRYRPCLPKWDFVLKCNHKTYFCQQFVQTMFYELDGYTSDGVMKKLLDSNFTPSLYNLAFITFYHVLI